MNGTRNACLLAAAAALTLTATACGDETAKPASGDQASETPTSPATSAGGVVLDRPWAVQLQRTHENEMSTSMVYVRVTPSTGESTSLTVDIDSADGVDGNHHTLVDGAGAWAISANLPTDPKQVRVRSLTGDEDVVLDLHEVTAKPEAVSLDPSRTGVLRVLGEDDTLTDYDLASGKKTPVELAKPKPGHEYRWWFSSADGMPLAAGRERAPDLGSYQPNGAVAGDPEAKVCPDEYGGWMLSYPFTDATDAEWAVCQSIDGPPELRFMERSGKKWKQVATADVKLPSGTEIYAVIPAVS